MDTVSGCSIACVLSMRREHGKGVSNAATFSGCGGVWRCGTTWVGKAGGLLWEW